MKNIEINTSVIYTEEVKSEDSYWVKYKRKALKRETLRQCYGNCWHYKWYGLQNCQEMIVYRIITILTDFEDIEYIRILDGDFKSIIKLDSDTLQTFFEAYKKQY